MKLYSPSELFINKILYSSSEIMFHQLLPGFLNITQKRVTKLIEIKWIFRGDLEIVKAIDSERQSGVKMLQRRLKMAAFVYTRQKGKHPKDK